MQNPPLNKFMPSKGEKKGIQECGTGAWIEEKRGEESQSRQVQNNLSLIVRRIFDFHNVELTGKLVH